MKKAFIQLHIAVFLAGFTGVLGRLITLNEAVLVWYRLMITCVVLWILLFVQEKENRLHRAQTICTGFQCGIYPRPSLGNVLCGYKNFQCFYGPGLSFGDGIFYGHSGTSFATQAI